MESEIEFGDVEESRPEIELRPDRNKHFAVVACGQPGEDDLPVYADLDVMRDIEAHALTNTDVELGGVLLGGQYEDADGNPFVVVSDAIRAEHYEATKGSFKFTHETWEAISRQREEFPPGIQMVGWYHTHPDWGVFLSGMDMFICDNFFSRPLDLALVIDPCRGDRGWFYWLPRKQSAGSKKIKRASGFYIFASRFRHEELIYFASLWGGHSDMARDPRYQSFSGQSGSSPIVNILDSRNSWLQVAVLGMLAMQFLFLLLFAWKLIFDSGASSKEMSDSIAQIQHLTKQEREFQAVSSKVAAQSEVIDRLLAANGSSEKTREDWEEQQEELNSLRAAEHALSKQYIETKHEKENYQGLFERKNAEYKTLLAKNEEAKKQIESLRNSLSGKETENNKGAMTPWYLDFRFLLTLLLVGVVAGLGGYAAAWNSRNEDEATDRVDSGSRMTLPTREISEQTPQI